VVKIDLLKAHLVETFKGVSIHWTGLLEWTTGLTQTAIKCLCTAG